MISRVDLRGRSCASHDLPRARLDVEAAVASVRPIVEAVRDRGRDAVVELTAQFDGVQLDDIRVPEAVLHQALEDLDPAVRAALEEAIRRAQRVHRAQLRDDEVVDVAPGAVVTERWVPVG
ncbi:MAG TPA: histidinol dehydrogenase, partial [Mycobacteriales bacterium]|nr:histidinol dehydrogenase [Mycobacteriales bacterium]